MLLDLEGKVLQRLPFSGDRSIRCGHVLDFTPDGRRIAAVSTAGVSLYDVFAGNLSREITVQSKNIFAIRLSRPGTLAIATEQGVQIHHLDQPDSHFKTFGDKEAYEIAMSHDGKWLAAPETSSLTVWDLYTGRTSLPQGRYPQGGFGVAFAPDDSEMAISTERISFLRCGTWEPVRNQDEHHYQLKTGLISDDRLWTGELGPTIREWDYERGVAIRSLKREGGTTSALAKIDDTHLAVAGGAELIEIKNIITGKTVYTLRGHGLATVALAYFAPRRQLISVGDDGMARSWDLDSKEMRYEGRITDFPNTRSILQFAVAPNGESFAFSNAVTSETRAFSAENGTELWRSTIGRRISLYSPVAFTPDSLHVLSTVKVPDIKTNGDLKFSVRIVETLSGKKVSRLNCCVGTVCAIAISPDGQYAVLYTSNDHEELHIQVWSLATSSLVTSFPGLGKFVRSMCFSPDGDKLITLSKDTTAIVWDFKGAIQQVSVTRKEDRKREAEK